MLSADSESNKVQKLVGSCPSVGPSAKGVERRKDIKASLNFLLDLWAISHGFRKEAMPLSETRLFRDRRLRWLDVSCKALLLLLHSQTRLLEPSSITPNWLM